MLAYLIPLIAWIIVFVAIQRDADAYKRAHPEKRSAHGEGESAARPGDH